MSQLSESALRRKAHREGYRMVKSRRPLGIHNRGEFMLVKADIRGAVLGSDYDATLEDIHAYLADDQ